MRAIPTLLSLAVALACASPLSAGEARRALLARDDFTYRGFYAVPSGGDFAELHYGQGFTHRYIGGQLRFLTLSFFGNVPGGGYHLIEFAPPPSLGGTAAFVNHWPDIWTGTGLDGENGRWIGLWYEESAERLWTTWAIDYPGAEEAGYTRALALRTLNADGTCSTPMGPWGLEGVQQRRIYGGVQAIPSWFRSRFGVGPYAVGWGGYASRMTFGASLGPTLYAIPDPTNFPTDEGGIPSSAFKTLMDHGAGTRQDDWYAAGAPTSFDRGVRNSGVTNDYDGGTNWLSPAPDGEGRWVWGDSPWNTGCWIETPSRHGFVLVPKFSNGRAWYEASTLHCDRQSAEIQVFDPAMLGEVAQGARPPWQTYPASRWEITADAQPLGLMGGNTGNNPGGGPAGASYDPVTGRLYVYCIGGAGNQSFILVYDVNGKPDPRGTLIVVR